MDDLIDLSEIGYTADFGTGSISFSISGSPISDTTAPDSANAPSDSGIFVPNAIFNLENDTLTFQFTFNEESNFADSYSNSIPVKAEVPQNTTIPLEPLFGIGLAGTAIIAAWDNYSEKQKKKEKNADTASILAGRSPQEITEFQESTPEPSTSAKILNGTIEAGQKVALLAGVDKTVTTHG